ncbi:MAG: 6-pyruvoyl-tetrahydropterin synthase-related protein [Candidatus Methanoperedens sp.]|nr:6-pyruvoyl-tetrahydropterin synthase-related protein [Candidatus Methanoperedens sp.]
MPINGEKFINKHEKKHTKRINYERGRRLDKYKIFLERISNNKEKISIFLIVFVSLFYTRTLLLSSNDFIPSGLDFDSNLSPIAYMLNSNFSLWNDSWMLGFPDYAGPLNNIFYPISTLTFFLFGIVLGLKILIFIHVLLSGVGFYFFSQNLTKNNWARMYGSIIYMLSGSLAAKIYAGHLEKLMIFPWIPIALYFFYKAIDDERPKYLIFSSISASMFIFAGDAYGAIFFLFLFVAFFSTKIIYSTNHKKTIYIFLKIIVFTLLIVSLKLIPLVAIKDYLTRSIDVLAGLENVFLVFSHFYSTRVNDFYGGWEDYSFIGYLPFILFIIGFIFHKSKEKYYLILSIIIALIWVQDNIPYLAKEIHSLPILNNFRIPTRIYLFLTFYIIAISTLGFDYTINKLKEKNISNKNIFYFSFILLIFSSYAVYSTNFIFLKTEIDESNMKIYDDLKIVYKSFEQKDNIYPAWIEFEKPENLLKYHVFIQKGYHNFNSYYGYSFNYSKYININNINYSIPDIQISMSPNEDDKNKLFIQAHKYNNSLPSVFVIRGDQIVTDNSIVETYQPGNVVINLTHVLSNDVIVLKMNWYKYWFVYLDDEKHTPFETNSYQGLLSFQIPSSQEKLRIHFKYIPNDLYIGLSLMLLSVPLYIILYIFNKRKSIKYNRG